MAGVRQSTSGNISARPPGNARSKTLPLGVRKLLDSPARGAFSIGAPSWRRPPTVIVPSAVEFPSPPADEQPAMPSQPLSRSHSFEHENRGSSRSHSSHSRTHYSGHRDDDADKSFPSRDSGRKSMPAPAHQDHSTESHRCSSRASTISQGSTHNTHRHEGLKRSRDISDPVENPNFMPMSKARRSTRTGHDSGWGPQKADSQLVRGGENFKVSTSNTASNSGHRSHHSSHRFNPDNYKNRTYTPRDTHHRTYMRGGAHKGHSRSFSSHAPDRDYHDSERYKYDRERSNSRRPIQDYSTDPRDEFGIFNSLQVSKVPRQSQDSFRLFRESDYDDYQTPSEVLVHRQGHSAEPEQEFAVKTVLHNTLQDTSTDVSNNDKKEELSLGIRRQTEGADSSKPVAPWTQLKQPRIATANGPDPSSPLHSSITGSGSFKIPLDVEKPVTEEEGLSSEPVQADTLTENIEITPGAELVRTMDSAGTTVQPPETIVTSMPPPQVSETFTEQSAEDWLHGVKACLGAPVYMSILATLVNWKRGLVDVKNMILVILVEVGSHAELLRVFRAMCLASLDCDEQTLAEAEAIAATKHQQYPGLHLGHAENEIARPDGATVM